MGYYLDFEKKIEAFQEELELAKIRNNDDEILRAQEDFDRIVKSVYSKLTDYQKLQLARHQDRPYALDYIKLIMDERYELHGDRHYKDDNSIVCFIGKIDNERCIVIGEEKGRGTKNKLKRNFGMPNPEGYRKALRVAKLAEKFNIPLLMLVDTPGAYPGVGAEERSQSEAIARNLYEYSDLKTISISVVIGEGGSGGALAISVADKLAMLQYSVYSVISPEGCAAILWDDPTKVEAATSAMKITAQDLKELHLIDDIINEPGAGAHRDKKATAMAIKDYFLNSVKELRALDLDERLQNRYTRICKLGSFSEE